jgi:hypothetical protein
LEVEQGAPEGQTTVSLTLKRASVRKVENAYKHEKCNLAGMTRAVATGSIVSHNLPTTPESDVVLTLIPSPDGSPKTVFVSKFFPQNFMGSNFKIIFSLHLYR